MAEIFKRRNGEILRTIFDILLATPEPLQAGDVLKELERRLPLTPYEQGTFASGGRRFEKIARFATVGVTKAGWLTKHRGRWSVTEEGRRAHGRFRDPEEFCKAADNLYRDWRSAQPDASSADSPLEDVTSPERVSIKWEEAEESAWGEIDAFVGSMNPYDFQELVGALLRALGYFVAWTAPRGKDGGIDLIAYPDPLGTKHPRIKVQVKRQQASISVDGLRAFMATLGADDVGLFIATGGFTRDAQEEARAQSTRRITLIDLERLFSLWVEHSPSLPDEDRRRLPLKPVYFLSPE